MLTWIILAIVAAALLYWGVSLAIGIFGDKEKVGAKYLERALTSKGIDADRFSRNSLFAISKNALMEALYSNPPIGKYDATAFKKALDWRAELISRHLSGIEIGPDSQELFVEILGSDWDTRRSI